MANHLGKEGVLKFSSTTVSEFRDYAYSESADVVEDTVIGDTWKTSRATHNSWRVSANLFWDETDTGQNQITVGQQVTVNLYPEGIASTATYKTGAAIITEYTINGAANGLVEASFTATGTGSVSTTTVP